MGMAEIGGKGAAYNSDAPAGDKEKQPSDLFEQSGPEAVPPVIGSRPPPLPPPLPRPVISAESARPIDKDNSGLPIQQQTVGDTKKSWWRRYLGPIGAAIVLLLKFGGKLKFLARLWAGGDNWPYALCAGNGCLSNSEALNDDPLARKLFGVSKFAGQTQVGQWLREQGERSVATLRQLGLELVCWLTAQVDPRLLLHAGQLEVFFDKTQLELSGERFEGAAYKYNGDWALSWQVLWVGLLLADRHVGSPKAPS